jgi:mRNA-decapping enzyme subunit 2
MGSKKARSSAESTDPKGGEGGAGESGNSSQSAYEEVCVELAARFVLNAPPEELADDNRLFFLLEQAHWYYMDFSCEQNKKLPGKGRLDVFGKDLCGVVPSLKDRLKNFQERFMEFKKYKFGIPTCGAVLLNPTMDKCLMVKGWGKESVSLGFPKGKMDAGESEAECAAREVEEEIGVDIRKYIVEEDKIVFFRRRQGQESTAPQVLQKNTLYIIQGISEETKFLTHTRKEISDIVWNPLWIFELPKSELQKYKGKYGHCFPALRPIILWVKKKRKEQNQPQTHDLPTPASPAAGKAAAMTLEDLENELLAGYGEEEDEADDPYEAFSALTDFKFDTSAIMRPFLKS